jgi:3',5'-cyclic AMP phosphodiesterase CpdA
MTTFTRRDFLHLAGLASAGIAGVACASGLHPLRQAHAATKAAEEFVFLQLSDTHWGFTGPAINPDAAGTLPKTIATINALEHQPDFLLFTGDLTHTTDDATERRTRMAQFRDLVHTLHAPRLYFLPGEHDASLDHGEAYREFFGESHYTFDHNGVHFIVLDNVSDPSGSLGDAQLQWLRADLARLAADQPIVVLTHRPLFDLAPDWDWATRDGAQALQALMPFQYVTVFYGHIHQEHHFTTGHIFHHAAKSLIFPLPAPGSVPKKAPIPWDSTNPYRGLGFRTVSSPTHWTSPTLTERPVVKG